MQIPALFIFLIASLLQPSAAPAMNTCRFLNHEIVKYEQLFNSQGDWQWHADDSRCIDWYLHHALSKTMNPAFVAKIIYKGANIQAPQHITDTWIMSPLATAVRVMHADKNLENYFSNIMLLLEQGAHFCDGEKEIFLLSNCLEQLRNRVHNNPDWKFEEERSAELIKRLIERGPFLLAPDQYCVPLTAAVGMPSVVKYLLERGLRPEDGKYGGNALQEARISAHSEIQETSSCTAGRESLALIQDTIRRDKLAREIPALAKENNCQLKKIPTVLILEIGKYIAY